MATQEQYSDRNFEFLARDEAAKLIKDDIHVHRKDKKVVCETDIRGHKKPDGRSPLDLVVDASDGFIPLWAANTTLRWRFQEQSMANFVDPEAAKSAIRALLGDALLAWGDAVPVKFAERQHAWDFEIAVSPQENCTINGCTLARAFFPDAGRHDLLLYPTMFSQSREEQVETMAHEIGHVFGLRHFFADVSETGFPSEIFGAHEKFSIMNYGNESVLTDKDREDLSLLYEKVWDGSVTEINGTPVQLMRPFSFFRVALGGTNPFAMG